MSATGRANGPNQLSLHLPEARRALRRGEYVVTEANREARDFAANFVRTGEPFLIVCGPSASGKTHLLVDVFGADNIVAATEAYRVGDRAFVALDDCDRFGDERSFLDLIASRRKPNTQTVLAGAGRPRAWAKSLNDLATRLEAMPRAELAEPDEALLSAVLLQHFKTRQMEPRKGLVAFAAPRIPKTFAAADAFVEAVVAAVNAGAPLDFATAKSVIENLFEGPSRT